MGCSFFRPPRRDRSTSYYSPNSVSGSPKGQDEHGTTARGSQWAGEVRTRAASLRPTEEEYPFEEIKPSRFSLRGKISASAGSRAELFIELGDAAIDPDTAARRNASTCWQ